jgi:hypothetical protein
VPRVVEDGHYDHFFRYMGRDVTAQVKCSKPVNHDGKLKLTSAVPLALSFRDGRKRPCSPHVMCLLSDGEPYERIRANALARIFERHQNGS